MESLVTLTELSRKLKFSEDALRELFRVYDSELETVVRALRSPGKRYYLRANTLKARPEHVMKKLAASGFEVSQHETIPEALWIPTEGPREIRACAKKVMVEKFTAESVLQGANVYAPGIVRCNKLRLGDSVNVVDDEGEILASGIARMTETQILTFRKGLAIEVLESRYRVPSFRETREYQDGLIYPQSLPAILTSRVLNPKAGDVVLDMTCSPGGKLSHISQLMENQGQVIGVDRNRVKINAAMETCTRMGCANTTLFVHDSRYLDADLASLRPDKILVDPPCSALGIMPQVYQYATTNEIEALAKYQKQFLSAASRIVKPGGRIVYSVCTLTLQECERNALYGETDCELSITDQSPMLGAPAPLMESKPDHCCQRFHPHKHDAGYFIASFKKDINDQRPLLHVAARGDTAI